jgi:hypothetical protein
VLYSTHKGNVMLKSFVDGRVIPVTLFDVSTILGHTYISSVQFWHEVLGHSSPQQWIHAQKIYNDGNFLPKRPSNFHCSTCALFNSKHQTPSAKSTRSKKVYDKIHTDLAGPFSVQSLGKHVYYMTLIDDHSRYTEIVFLKKKSDATSQLCRFCERVYTQTERYPRSVRSDQGGEYINNGWTTYGIEKGIIHETTAVYSPELNGIAERANLTLANMCRPALSDLPPSLWAEAFN